MNKQSKPLSNPAPTSLLAERRIRRLFLGSLYVFGGGGSVGDGRALAIAPACAVAFACARGFAFDLLLARVQRHVAEEVGGREGVALVVLDEGADAGGVGVGFVVPVLTWLAYCTRFEKKEKGKRKKERNTMSQIR